MRKQRLAGQRGRKDRGGRREQENAPAAIGEPNEKPKRDENADESHARHTPSSRTSISSVDRLPRSFP